MTGDDGELSAARRNGKSEAAFRTISEVADDLDVPQHVLRFWEGKFPQVKPLKRGGGRRYYRPDDVALLRRIRDLLYSEGYTIKGVQKLLKEGGAKESGNSVAPVPVELELSLGLQEPELQQDEEGQDDSFAPDQDDDAEHRQAIRAMTRAGGDDLPVHSGTMSPELRRNLEALLDDLEQLRSLLQPR